MSILPRTRRNTWSITCQDILYRMFQPTIPVFATKSAVPNAVCYQNAMFTPASMDPEVVYGVVKAIFENSSEFVDSHPAAKYWTLTYKPIALAVPYHDGAIKYYKEKGIWTAEDQAYQEKILKKQEEILKSLKK